MSDQNQMESDNVTPPNPAVSEEQEVPLEAAAAPAASLEAAVPVDDHQGGDDETLTAEELKAAGDEVRFRQHCIKRMRGITDDLKAVHRGQVTAGKQRGEMARTVALLALDQATLQDQFKNKTISRVLADKMLDIAAKEGVETETLQEFAVKHLGPEGLIKTHAEDGNMDQLIATTVSSVHEEAAAVNRKRQLQESKKANSSKKVKKGEQHPHPPEDTEVCDPDGVCVAGKMSRENEVLLRKFGIVGNGIKGYPGIIIRLKDKKHFNLPDSVRKSATSAAVEVCSTKDRLSISEHWGETMYVFINVVLKDLVDKKNRHAPFYFEDLVEDPDATAARDLNNKQPLIWHMLLRSALGNMKLHEATEVVKLNGLKNVIKKLKQKVIELGKVKKEAPPQVSHSPKDPKPDNNENVDF